MSFWEKITPDFIDGGIDLAAEQQREADSDAKIMAYNQKLVEKGTITQSDYDKANARLSENEAGTGLVVEAFKEGAVEGLNNLGDKIQSATNFSFGAIFKLIPWQAWIIGALVLFFWLGGAAMLRGRLARA